MAARCSFEIVLTQVIVLDRCPHRYIRGKFSLPLLADPIRGSRLFLSASVTIGHANDEAASNEGLCMFVRRRPGGGGDRGGGENRHAGMSGSDGGFAGADARVASERDALARVQEQKHNRRAVELSEQNVAVVEKLFSASAPRHRRRHRYVRVSREQPERAGSRDQAHRTRYVLFFNLLSFFLLSAGNKSRKRRENAVTLPLLLIK